MVFVSIQPFAFKRIFFLVAALLCLSSAICFADSLFMTSRSTPYGRQLNPIEILSVPKRAVQPPLLGQSLDGEFAEESEWILSETYVLNPTIIWLTRRSEKVMIHFAAPRDGYVAQLATERAEIAGIDRYLTNE